MASALRVQVSPSAFFFSPLVASVRSKLRATPRPSSPEPSPLQPPASAETAVVVLVSNGPGELTTWVRPVAQRLHRLLAMRPQQPGAACGLRLVLVPCPNGTGQEHQAAAPWNLFERITPARQFWSLLLRPERFGPWPKQGVVVFLGGDQFWTVLLSAQIGRAHV